MILSRRILQIFIIIGVTILGVSASYQDEVTLTAQEKAALDKFKAIVIPKIPASSYIQNYKKDDLYFIRWVRTSSLDVAAAERSFLNHLKWREDERIDTLLNEDWSDMKHELPTFVDTTDKLGRPILELWVTEANMRQITLAGKSRRTLRWMTRNMELFNRRIFSARAEGKEISQGVLICAIEGFNLVRHACPACIPVYASFMIMFQTHYAGTVGDAFMMDTPSTFQIVLNIAKAVIPDLVKFLRVYTGKEEGFKALDKQIDREQRSLRFGGTLSRDVAEHL